VSETIARTWDCNLKGISMAGGDRSRDEALEYARTGATEALGRTLMFRLRELLQEHGTVTATFGDFSLNAVANDKRGTAEGTASVEVTFEPAKGGETE